MSQTLQSARHETLIALLIQMRKKAGMPQSELAKKLAQHQSFVARLESGERRIDVVEFLGFAEAIGFDPRIVITRLKQIAG
jgi:transcriptional regulator with XRE-family HTH domain